MGRDMKQKPLRDSSWKEEKLRLCSHYGQLFVSARKAFRQGRDGAVDGAVRRGRVWCTKFQSSLMNIYFRFSGFQSSLRLTRDLNQLRRRRRRRRLQRQKTIGFITKTTALHVHHAFQYISLTSTARLRRVKPPNATFYGGRGHKKTNFPFSI